MKGQGIGLGWCRDFVCPGGDCGLTCCRGDWKILLTEEEIEYYKNLDHEFRDKILEGIDMEKKVFKCDNGRCNMLNSEGYCNIVLNCGEDKLCHTCRTFPRQNKLFGDVLEYGVEIVCPLVAERLLDSEPIDFDMVEVELDNIKSIDYNVYDSLAQVRASIVSVLQLEMGTKELLPGKMYIMFNMYQQALNKMKEGSLSVESVSSLSDSYCSESRMPQYFLECSKLGDLHNEKVAVIVNILMNAIRKGFVVKLCDCCSESYPNLGNDIETWVNNSEILSKDMEEYVVFMKNKFPYFTEKFFAYIWFMDGVTLDPEEYERKLCSRTMEHLLINIAAMSVYKTGGKNISEKEFAVVIAAVDRFISHNRKVQRDLQEMFNELKATSMTNLLLMIMC